MVLALVAGTATASAVTVTGNVKWTDSAGGTHNARRVQYVVVEEHPILGSIIAGAGRTDLDGNYSEAVTFRPGYTGYAVIVLADNDAGFVASDGTVANTYSIFGGFRHVLDPSTHIDTTIDHGTPNGRAFSIVDAMYTSWRFGLSGRAADPTPAPPPVACAYPVAGTVPYFNGILNIVAGGENDWDTAMHEYSHYLSSLDPLDNEPGGPHTWGTSSIPGLGKGPGTRLGWGEGFANWAGIAAQHHDPVGGHSPAGVPNVGDTRYDDTVQGFWTNLETSATSWGVDHGQGEGDELSVCRILWDLGDAANEGYDRVALGHEILYRRLRAISIPDASSPSGFRGVETLHDVWMDLAGGATIPIAGLVDMGAIFEQHKVSPSPLDDFVTTPIMVTGGAPTFSWLRQNNGENDTFEIKILAGDLSDILLTITVPTSTSTYTLSDAQWDALKALPLGAYQYSIVGGDRLVGMFGAVRPAADQTLGYWSGSYGLTLLPTPGAATLLGLGMLVVRVRRGRSKA